MQSGACCGKRTRLNRHESVLDSPVLVEFRVQFEVNQPLNCVQTHSLPGFSALAFDCVDGTASILGFVNHQCADRQPARVDVANNTCTTAFPNLSAIADCGLGCAAAPTVRNHCLCERCALCGGVTGVTVHASRMFERPPPPQFSGLIRLYCYNFRWY